MRLFASFGGDCRKLSIQVNGRDRAEPPFRRGFVVDFAQGVLPNKSARPDSCVSMNETAITGKFAYRTGRAIWRGVFARALWLSRSRRERCRRPVCLEAEIGGQHLRGVISRQPGDIAARMAARSA